MHPLTSPDDDSERRKLPRIVTAAPAGERRLLRLGLAASHLPRKPVACIVSGWSFQVAGGGAECGMANSVAELV